MSLIFTVAIFTAAKPQKQSKRPSAGEWIIMGYMEYCSAIKKSEIMPSAATQMERLSY